MAKSWKRAKPRGSPEIPHTRIGGDTRDFARNGTGRKAQDGMLGWTLVTGSTTINFSLI
jgi:hypothetical protein